MARLALVCCLLWTGACTARWLPVLELHASCRRRAQRGPVHEQRAALDLTAALSWSARGAAVAQPSPRTSAPADLPATTPARDCPHGALCDFEARAANAALAQLTAEIAP